MKSKTLVLFAMAFLFAAVFAVNAQAKSHKVRMEMTGCLQNGSAPDSFVLSNISNGYTIRNQTGQTPLALARAEDVILIPQKSDSKLQKHVGQRVKVFGYSSSNTAVISPESTTTVYDNGVATTTTTAVNASEFKVTKIKKAHGSCP